MPTGVLVAFTVVMGLFAQPFMSLANEAATSVSNPQHYIDKVFSIGCPSAGGGGPGGEGIGHGGDAMIRRVGYFVRYLFIFTKHLVLANYQVAKVVLAPTMKIRPGFLAVPMEAASDFEITSLANSITLTPGTISVHVERDAGLIVVHFLDVGNDLDAARANIKRSLEGSDPGVDPSHRGLR